MTDAGIKRLILLEALEVEVQGMIATDYAKHVSHLLKLNKD